MLVGQILVRIPALIFAVVLSLLVVALARPQRVVRELDDPRNALDLMLVIDTSEVCAP